MQSTSALWKRLWASGARLEAVAVIAGTEYAGITGPVIRRALTQDGLGVGNAVSATCGFTVRAAGPIPKAAEVVVRIRLTDGAETSEWLPAGTFYVSHRTRDAVTGLTTLECYDAMLKANAAYARDGLWPRSMAQVAAEIAEELGVELDARCEFQSGDDFRVLLPEAGATIREVLGGIASAHGGNWIITPQNRLRLVPLGTGSEAVAVRGVLGGIATGAEQTVTGLRVTGIGEERRIGTEDGLVLEIASPYVTEGGLTWLAGQLIGLAYQPFELRAAVYDPAAELGDGVNRLSDVASALYSESASLGPAFRGDIAAPEPGELADEYPYLGTGDRLKLLKEEVRELAETKADEADVAAAEARAVAVTRALGESLTQQELFNRLTNNGEAQGIYLKDGKLYINATYMDTGILDADLLRAGIITDASGENYWVLDGQNSEFVTRKGVIGDFTLDNGSLLYGTLEDGGQGAYIGKNGVYYNTTYSGGETAMVRVFGQGVDLYWGGKLKTRLYLNTAGLIMGCYDANDTLDWPFQVYDNTDKSIYLRYNTNLTKQVEISGQFKAYSAATFYSNLTVNGTKNRAVATGEYGERLLYCYETPSPMFGDVGEGVIGEDGRCWVWLDPVFADTVAADQYQVFLQKYGAGDCWVAERRGACFIVEGTPGLAFGWELKARQKDFDQLRLERFAEPADITGADYGALAMQHIENLKEGRISA